MLANILNNPVLVLNKGWVAVDACTVKEAICSAITERAKIICPNTFAIHYFNTWVEQPINETDRFIRSANFKIKVPEIIVSNYEKTKMRSVRFCRRNLWKRDKQLCQYCGKKPRYDEITIDHIIPKSRGGRTIFKNCVLACFQCNTKKMDRTPTEAGMTLKRIIKTKDGKIHEEIYTEPIAPRWSPLYAIKHNQTMPESWPKFLQNIIDDLYWNIELEEN